MNRPTVQVGDTIRITSTAKVDSVYKGSPHIIRFIQSDGGLSCNYGMWGSGFEYEVVKNTDFKVGDIIDTDDQGKNSWEILFSYLDCNPNSTKLMVIVKDVGTGFTYSINVEGLIKNGFYVIGRVGE